MSRTEMLARYGIRDRSLAIEPIRSEIDGVWRIKITPEGAHALYFEVATAAKLAHELRSGGERLLATRIEIGIEQARRSALSEQAA
jgi:hypothetical protein